MDHNVQDNDANAENVVELRIKVPQDLAQYMRKLVKLRRQSLDEFLILCVEEHIHCLDAEGRLLPFDFT